MGTPISDKLLTGGAHVALTVNVARKDCKIGDTVEYVFGETIATANAKKRKGVVFEDKNITDANGEVIVIVSGVIQRKGLTTNTDANVNDLSEFDIFAI